jgi:hypothetical protein
VIIMPTVTVRFEQAVYGSFPFWHRGYAVLAQSAGCRPEWLAELRAACQRYGEPPAGTRAAESRFALRLRSGPWMIAGVYPQGCDDRDRPGALAFHALFVGRWSYWRTGADPFAFATAIHGDWCPEDEHRTLPAGQLSLRRTWLARSHPDPTAAADDPRLQSIVTALTRRRRVVVQSSAPIDALARSVWLALPGRVRRRASVATWVFDGASHFDLVALPKLAGIDRDAFELILTHEQAGSPRDQAAFQPKESRVG